MKCTMVLVPPWSKVESYKILGKWIKYVSKITKLLSIDKVSDVK